MPPRFFGDDDSGWPAPAPASTRRVALVIGNGSYRTSRLDNPARDARLVGETLGQLGFDTELVIDAGKAVLETAIVRLGERLEKAGPEAVGFFYFAGHGIQHLGVNYLVPVDAQIPDTRYLKSGAVMVDYLVEELARAHSLANVVVLDACRDSAVRDSGGGMTQGLASIKNLPDGTLVVFSTAAGQVAEDGQGDHSPYAKALVRHLCEPNRRLEEIFFAVSRDVAQATGNLQRPALFVQGAIAPVVLKPAPAPPAAPLPPGSSPASSPLPEAALPDPPPAPASPGSAPSQAAPAPEMTRTLVAAEAPADEPLPPPVPMASPAPALAEAAAPAAPPASRPVQGMALPAGRPAGGGAPRWLLPAAGAGAAAVAAAIAVIAGGLFLRPQPAAVNLADPASWPVAAGTAVLRRVPQGERCGEGWARVLDGLYCLRSGEPLGAVWDSGRLAAPLAAAMTLKVSPRRGARCGDGAVFESEAACLEPVRPDWLADALRHSGPVQIDVAGALAGTADLLPRAAPACTEPGAQFPFSGSCLAGAGRFGIVAPTMLGHERLGGAPAEPVRLTAYQKLTVCPRLDTLLENDQYCLVGPVW